MRIQTCFFFFVLLGLSITPSQVVGLEFQWSGRRSLFFDYTQTSQLDIHTTSDDADGTNDNYQDLRNLIHLLFRLERYALQLRLDTATFFAEPQLQDTKTPYLDQINVEKVSASYMGDKFSLKLGDFYATFGRGLALRIRKEDELGWDHTLLGAKVRYRFDQLQATLLSGLLNVLNSDAEYEKAVSDPFDFITGLEFIATRWPKVTPHVHAVAFVFDPFDRLTESTAAGQRAYIMGSALDVYLDQWGTAYAEVDWMGRQYEQSDIKNSWAAYASWDWELGSMGVQLEFKSYHDYELSSYTSTRQGKYQPVKVLYLMGPTLEPADSEVENDPTISAGRLSVDWRIDEIEATLFGSYAGFVNRSLWLYHALVGYEQRLFGRGKARLTVGIRERNDDGSDGFSGRIYLKGDFILPLNSTQSVSLQGKSWLNHINKQQTADLVLHDWSVVYHWSPHLDLGVTLQYDTQQAKNNRQIFYSTNLSLRFFDGQLLVRLFAGHARAGPLCVQGSCRILPSFSGVRIETVVRL